MSKKCDNILLTLYLIIALLSLNKYIQLKTRSACVLVAGTQRFFLAGVAKYCSASQDVTHNFAKRGTDKLFLYDERKTIFL